MKSQDLIQIIVQNWYSALFLKEFEDCRQINPRCTVEQLRSDFVAKHPILNSNKDRFRLYHQGLALSLAYSFLVLPYESDEDIKNLKSKMSALTEFKIKIKPPEFQETTSEWLKYLRNAISHGNIEINASAGISGDECWVFWNHTGGKRSNPKNFEVTCSYITLMQFLDEYTKKIVPEILEKG